MFAFWENWSKEKLLLRLPDLYIGINVPYCIKNVQNIDIILFIIHRNEIEEQEDNFSKILENCFTLYKNGIKKVNQTLSLTLLFMITFALIGLVSSVYTTLSFIFFTGKNHVLGKVIDTKYYKQ